MESVVQLICNKSKTDFEMPFQPQSSVTTYGTGFFIDQQRLLTCAHVVENSISIYIHIPEYGIKLFPVRIVSICDLYDIALLEIEDAVSVHIKNVFCLEKNGMKIVKMGDQVDVLGYPLGQTHLKKTSGIINGQQFHLYQTDCPINNGNSGGPLVFKNRVIGLCSAGVGSANNIGFAIPIERFLKIKTHLERESVVRVPAEWGFLLHALYENDDTKYGMHVYDILPDSLVSMSHGNTRLQKGDVLLSIHGKKVLNDGTIEDKWMLENKDLIDLLYEIDLDVPISFSVLRGCQQETGTWRNQAMKYKIDRLFFPLEHLSYCVLAGAVCLQLCTNLLHEVQFEILSSNEIKNDQNYISKGFNKDNFEGFLEALSNHNRNKPRVIIFNILAGTQLSKQQILTQGDFIHSVNNKRIRTIPQLVHALHKNARSTDLFLIKTESGKQFSISRQKLCSENQRVMDIYGISEEKLFSIS